MRTIGVVTVGRSDYSIYRPVLRRIKADPQLRLRLIVAGMHLSPEFGMTVNAIEEDGFCADERVEMSVSSDSPEGIAKSMGLGTIGFAQVFGRNRLDVLLVLGDRFEMLAAVAASLPFNIPVAHIHGGESSEGAIDNLMRHGITKMSHLHFASTETHARRIVQMGEEPWRVTVSGAPALDDIDKSRLLPRQELESRLGMDLSDPPLLVTYHPVTLEHEQTGTHVAELMSALDSVGMPVVFTYPNADAANRLVIDGIERYTRDHQDSRAVVSMGSDGYFGLMGCASAMVGNSSSGIIEAASFRLPVVNVGNRQGGRTRARNVIDVECTSGAISRGIREASGPQFRESLTDLVNPYGDGHAAARIVERLRSVSLDAQLLVKRFHDIEASEPPKTLPNRRMASTI